MPEAAPEPARPMKWPLPIFDAKRLAPTGTQCMLREAKKYPDMLDRLLRYED